MTRLISLLATLALAALACAGCGGLDQGNSSLDSGQVTCEDGAVKVLAGSELRDMKPLLADIEKNTDVKLCMEYTSTLDGADAIASGTTDAAFGWFANSKYIQLVAQEQGKSVTATTTMRSPVVFGVKQDIARKYGWDDPKAFVTWKDLADKAAAGELDYAMANPSASNSGFSALIGVAAATAGDGNALAADRIDNKVLKEFFKGQKLTAGGSGYLSDAYVKREGDLDGMINYESEILRLNASGKLDEKLTPVYPSEGLITGDYPLVLVKSDYKDQYNKVIAYIKTAKFQKKMMEQTHRRPAWPGVQMSDEFPSNLLIELPFPPKLDVVEKLLFAYLDENSRPSHTYYVLDTSGSMGEGSGRLELMQKAMNGLTGTDKSGVGRFTSFRKNEQITLIGFDDDVDAPENFTITSRGANGTAQQQIRERIENLDADGGTAIYNALAAAYDQALADRKKQPDLFYSVVLLTDGENTDGDDFSDFEDRYDSDYRDAKIPTFPVLFGDVNTDEMIDLADMTKGKAFDGRENLSAIFKEIRGYQ
jgi:Ca-activated chloride channel family protein